MDEAVNVTIYRVTGSGEVHYFATSEEGLKCKPGGQKPETRHRVDAAGECERLYKLSTDLAKHQEELRNLLANLYADAPGGVKLGAAGRLAAAAITRFDPALAKTMGITPREAAPV